MPRLVTCRCLFLLPSAALAADSFTVYVGYADNIRPSGFFPTPWLGASNVVSQTPNGEALDAGAIRIDNTGANPITITSTASILAASGDAALCAANALVVSFMENGNSFSATDTGQVLNTGGWDFASRGAVGGDGDESINWNVIGSQASRSGTTNFAAFCAELETFEEEHKRFQLESKFMPGKNSGGIDPPSEPVTLQLGTFSTTFPAGSFTETHSGKSVFEGQLHGVAWEVRIASLGDNSFTLKARGKGVDLSAMPKPVTVMPTIGNDLGSTAAFNEERDEEGEGRDH